MPRTAAAWAEKRIVLREDFWHGLGGEPLPMHPWEEEAVSAVKTMYLLIKSLQSRHIEFPSRNCNVKPGKTMNFTTLLI